MRIMPAIQGFSALNMLGISGEQVSHTNNTYCAGIGLSSALCHGNDNPRKRLYFYTRLSVVNSLVS